MARRPFTIAARGHDALHTPLGGEKDLRAVKVNVVHAGWFATTFGLLKSVGPTMYINIYGYQGRVKRLYIYIVYSTAL